MAHHGYWQHIYMVAPQIAVVKAEDRTGAERKVAPHSSVQLAACSASVKGLRIVAKSHDCW